MSHLRARRLLLTLGVVAVSATVAAAGMYFFVQAARTPSPSPFSGALTNASVGEVNSSYPYVRATLTFSSPTLVEPQDLILTLIGPNGSVKVIASPNGPTTSVDQLTLRYHAGIYPPWIAILSNNWYWTGYTMVCLDPGNVPVGGVNLNLPSASIIVSGATLTATFPGGPGFYSTAEGFTLVLADAGHPGSVSLTIA